MLLKTPAPNHRSKKALNLLLLLIAASCPAQPLARHGLHYETPATVWDEALPLGNGLLGALVWGDGKPLRISLDRTDLWDLRPVPEFHTREYSYKLMRQWVAEGRIDELHRLYDKPYWNPGPTKIPAGRIELSFDSEPAFTGAHLNLANALATVSLADSTTAEVFVHAERPVGMIRIKSEKNITPNLLAPPFAGKITSKGGPGIGTNDLAMLKYDAPKKASGANWTGFLQECWGGFKFAVALEWRRSGDTWLVAWSIATSGDGDNPLQIARSKCQRALDDGFDTARSSHQKWWDNFWAKSSIRIPNKIIERQWHIETYKFGSAARPDTPPITLQGPWTADNMKIPPWKGDYHHDLNTELCYWPAYSANHIEGETGFVNWLWDTRENARAWTKRFFNLPGLNIPMTTDLNQEQIGGWHQYTHSATTAAWLAHHFFLHYRYTMDDEFLTSRAYPFLNNVCVFLEAVTEPGPDGKRTLPLSSSPEINDNRLNAWFPSITNYDLALIRWALGTTADLADRLGKDQDESRWRSILTEMPQLQRDSDTGKLLVARDYPLKSSHRHFSHLMAIHPLGLIRWENGPDDQAAIKASLADLDALGTKAWCGYSFSWLANLAARARDGERAEKALEIFSTAFCLRNGFHCNGDQSGKGYSNFRYRPFTLEGNFAAAAAVQEMLLQSYSGTVRIMPAIPEDWKNVSFTSLRAEGAFLISAIKENGHITRVEIFAEKGGLCKLANPFDADFNVEGPGTITKAAGILHVRSAPGQRTILIRKR